MAARVAIRNRDDTIGATWNILVPVRKGKGEATRKPKAHSNRGPCMLVLLDRPIAAAASSVVVAGDRILPRRLKYT